MYMQSWRCIKPGATKGTRSHTAHLCMQSNRIWRSRWEGSCWRCRLRTKREPKVRSLLSAATSVTSGSNLHQVYGKWFCGCWPAGRAVQCEGKCVLCSSAPAACGKGHSVWGAPWPVVQQDAAQCRHVCCSSWSSLQQSQGAPSGTAVARLCLTVSTCHVIPAYGAFTCRQLWQAMSAGAPSLPRPGTNTTEFLMPTGANTSARPCHAASSLNLRQAQGTSIR